MVNRLDMDKKQGIHQLLASGMPKRQIARTLGVNRKSIVNWRSFLQKGATPSEALTAQALTGSEDSKGAKALTGSGEVQPIVAAEVLAPKEESNLPPGSRSKCASAMRLMKPCRNANVIDGCKLTVRFVPGTQRSTPLRQCLNPLLATFHISKRIHHQK